MIHQFLSKIQIIRYMGGRKCRKRFFSLNKTGVRSRKYDEKECHLETKINLIMQQYRQISFFKKNSKSQDLCLRVNPFGIC